MSDVQATHTSRFRIDELEERIAPVVHPFIAELPAELPGGNSGGVQAFLHGAIGPDSTSGVGAPVPLSNDGVGPESNPFLSD